MELAKALALAPDQPGVLNNLALSYALDGKAAEAEKPLRKAQRSRGRTPQVQENLALVLGLRGRYERGPIGGPGCPAARQGGPERGVPARAGPGPVHGGRARKQPRSRCRTIRARKIRQPAAAELSVGWAPLARVIRRYPPLTPPPRRRVIAAGKAEKSK